MENIDGDGQSVLVMLAQSMATGLKQAGPAVDVSSLAAALIPTVETVLGRLTTGRQTAAAAVSAPTPNHFCFFFLSLPILFSFFVAFCVLRLLTCWRLWGCRRGWRCCTWWHRCCRCR